MEKIKEFALKRPFLFGLVLILVYAILGTLTYPVHFLFPENEIGQLYGDTLAKFLIFIIFIIILWRFGWLRASGITRIGKVKSWLPIGLIIVFAVLTKVYAFTGDFSIRLPNSQLGFVHFLLNLHTSHVEETIFRGLVLVAMLIAWGNTRRGQIKAIILSSLIFGLIHFFNILVRPFEIVLFQSIVVTLQGMVFATLVVSYRSLWPVIIIHWLANAAVNVKLIGYEGFEEMFSMWIIYAISLIPLLGFGVYLFRKLPESITFGDLETG